MVDQTRVSAWEHLVLLFLLLGASVVISSAAIERNGRPWQAFFPTRGWVWEDKAFIGELAGQDGK
jgi:hypothetical protein